MIYESIYKKLDRLGVIALIETNTEAAKSIVGGPMMDLNFDRLRTEDGAVVIALAHYYEQNGDLCSDPDMEIRVWPDRKVAEALTFQMANPPVYTVVYPEPGMVNPRAKKELNSFLNTWLRNCINQDHHFTVTEKGGQ